MASLQSPRKMLLVLLGGAMMASSVQAAPARSDNTALDDVVVIGGRIAPTSEDPKSATCEFLATTDSFVRAQIRAAAGDPLMGPRIYQPTRLPREVDFVSEPVTTPGSALPYIERQFRGLTTRWANSADQPTGPTQRLYQLDQEPPSLTRAQEDMLLSAPSDFTRDDAIAACRDYQAIGGGGVGWGQGKLEIAYRDTFMPTAFTLFEERRYAESLGYFHRAFDKLAYEHGGDEAALMIGKLLLGAPGVPRDEKQAVVWLDRAGGARFDMLTQIPRFDPLAPTRNTAIGEAALILARIYQGGLGEVAKDPAKSRKWYERASHVGHVRAAAILGDIYAVGLDTPRDPARAFKYYKQAATLGYAPAQQALAEMYDRGEAPGGRNVRLALAWHNEAAKIGHAQSLHALAVAYETGEGVTADPQRALGLYKLAALSGSAQARNVIGSYFYEGRVLPKDQALARRWFERAVTGGDADAMYNLGAMMVKGEGGQADRTRAWVLLKLAQAGQQPQAPAAVATLEARMTPDEKAQAVRLLGPTRSS